VHQSPFIKDGPWVDRIGPTWIFNAGNQLGARPTHIIIDTDAGEALWFSSAGNQFTRLCDPLERPVPWLEAIPDWLRVADRPHLPGRHEFLVLMVNQRFEYLSDHAEMVALSLELPLQVDEIGRRGVKTLGEQFA